MLNVKKLLTNVLNMLKINTITFTKSQSASNSYVVARRTGHVVTVNGYVSGLTLSSGENAMVEMTQAINALQEKNDSAKMEEKEGEENE